MSVSRDDQRNATGLAYLRKRYVTRAKALVVDMPHVLTDNVNHIRAEWNQRFPQWKISVISPPDDLAVDFASLLGAGMLWPPGLLDDVRTHAGAAHPQSFVTMDAHQVWRESMQGFAKAMFPKRFFVNPFRGNHPATGVASACVLYLDMPGGLEGFIDALVPAFAITPESISISPFHRYPGFQAAFNAGMLKYYRGVVEDLLADDPERLNAIHLTASEVGWQAEREAHPDGPIPGDSSKWWWYLPILPGMSIRDVRNAESRISEAVKIVSKGDRPITEMVNELRSEGYTIDATADLLGIDRRSVTRHQTPG